MQAQHKAEEGERTCRGRERELPCSGPERMCREESRKLFFERRVGRLPGSQAVELRCSPPRALQKCFKFQA